MTFVRIREVSPFGRRDDPKSSLKNIIAEGVVLNTVAYFSISAKLGFLRPVSTDDKKLADTLSFLASSASVMSWKTRKSRSASPRLALLFDTDSMVIKFKKREARLLFFHKLFRKPKNHFQDFRPASPELRLKEPANSTNRGFWVDRAGQITTHRCFLSRDKHRITMIRAAPISLKENVGNPTPFSPYLLITAP